MRNRPTAGVGRTFFRRATIRSFHTTALATILAASLVMPPASAVAASGGNGQGGKANQLPIAKISGGNDDAWVGTPKVLDGTGSKDQDGTIVKYEWDFDANGTWDRVGTSPYATTTFTQERTYDVRLRVTDNSGAQSTDCRGFKVRWDSSAPVAVLTGPSNAAINQAVTFDGSGSYDSKGSIATYSWDFESDGVADLVGGADTAEHMWTTAGARRVTLTVHDFAGNTASASRWITIEGGTDATPQKPTGLIATDVPGDQGGAATLSWDASAEADVNRYRVYRTESENGPFVFVAQTTVALFPDSGLDSTKSYYYAVTAVDAAGHESDKSDAASVTPLDNVAPSTPVGLAVADVQSDQGTALALSWTANGEPDLAGYSLVVRDTVTGIVQTIQIPASDRTYPAEGLVVGRAYEFTLAAYDLSGNASSATVAVSGAPVDNLAPAAPGGLNAFDRVDDEGGVTVIEWPANTEADLAGYTLFRAALAPGDDPATALCTPLVNLPAATLSHTDEGALLGIDYVYCLVARDGAGNVSPASIRATTRSLDNRAPGAPMDISATDISPDQGGSVRVNWVPSISADVAGYRVSAIDSSGTVVETIEAGKTDRSHLFSSLAVGVDYTFSVVAYDAAGNVSGATTVVCAGHDEMAPAKPTELSATDVTPDEGGAIVVSWVANSEPDLGGYTLSVFTGGGAFIESHDVGFATSKPFENLTVGATYKFSLVARDINSNSSAATSRVSATANDELAPDEVTVSAIDHPDDQGGAIDISWTAAPQPDVMGYKLFRDGAEVKDLAGLSWTDSDAGTALRGYTVRAYDRSGNLSEPSNEAAVKAVDNRAPAMPTITSAVDVADDDGGAIKVTFTLVGDADVDGYRVFCYDTTGTVVDSRDTAALDNFTVVPVPANGVPYTFKVLAFDTSDNESDLSVGVEGIALDNMIPAVPAGLTATNVTPDEGGAINVSWAPNTETDLAGYTLTVFDVNDAVVEVLDAHLTTSTPFTGLTAGATYKFSVAARDLNGNVSEACTRVSAVAADETPPAAVTLSAVDRPDDQGGAINVSWTAAPESDLLGYKLYRNGALLKELSTLSWTDETAGTAARTYTVKAFDKSGNGSDDSNAVTLAALDNLKPGKPSIVGALDVPGDTGGAIAVTIAHVADADVTGYRATCSNGAVETLGAADTVAVFGGLTDGTTYSFTAVAFDAAGNVSDASDAVSGTSADNAAPAAPVGLAAADRPGDEGGTVLVSWTANTESDLAGYTLFRGVLPPGGDPDAVACLPLTSPPASDVTFTDETAGAGADYVYYLVARDIAGNASGGSVRATTRSLDNLAPSAPMGITATDVTPDQGGAVSVSWLPSLSADVTGYKVTVLDSLGGVFGTFESSTVFTHEFSGMAVGATYTFSVVAQDAAGNVSGAATDTQSGDDETKPATPAGLTATDVAPDQGGAINVSWTANTESDLAGYTLSVFDSSGSPAGVFDMGLSTTKSLSGLAVGQTYAFELVAADDHGNLSDAATASGSGDDEQAPAIPLILSADDVAADEGGSIRVRLQPVGDADVAGYRITCANETGEILATRVLGAGDTVGLFTGPTNDEPVYFTAVAFDGAGNQSAASSPPVLGVARDNLLPGVPGNLEAAPSDTSIALTWNASSGNPASYLVYSAMGADALSFEATVTGTAYTDTGLTTGQSYRYAVVARDAAGNTSAMTGEVSATTRDASAPTPPTSIIALSPAFDRVEVSWGGATDNVGVTGYTVQRSTNAGQTWATLTTTTNTYITDIAVTPATTYFYRIIAHDAEGNSSLPSDPYGVVTRSAPQRIRIENTQTGLITYTGTWNYIAGPVWANASGGSIHWTQFSSGSASFTFTGREITWISTKAPYRGIARIYIDGVLQPATVDCYSPTVIYQAPVFTKTFAEQGTHTIRVEHTGTRNPSASQHYIEVDAFDVMQDAPTAVRPLPPTSLTGAADGYNRIDLAWTASTSADIVGYRLERSTNGTTWSLVYTGPARTYADLTAQAGTSYSYRVTAFDGAGQISDPSAVTVVTTPPDVTAPAQPAAPSATVNGYESIALGWTATTDDIAVTGYELQRSANGGSTWSTVYSGSALTFTDATVQAGTAYQYRVRARDGAGNFSAPSTATDAATPADVTAPAAPASLTGTALNTTEISLTWSAAIDDLRVTDYSLEQSADGGGTWTEVYVGNGLTHLGTGLTPGADYVYRVVAVDAAGNVSAPTQLAISTPPPDTQAPEAPTNVVGTSPDYTKIALGWSPAVDNIAATGYIIERSLDLGVTWAYLTSTETTGIVDTGLSAETTYYYRVMARDAAGNWGPFSDPIGVMTPSAPPPIRVENTSSQIAYVGAWTLTTSAISPIYNGSSGQSVTWTQTNAGTASFTFTGRKISWISMKAPYRGIARVYIDGVAEPTLVDCYSSTVVYQVPVFTKTWAEVGTHTIKVECTGNKNPVATHNYIEIDAFAYQQ